MMFTKFIKMFADFCHKIKTRTSIKNLRHCSLQMDIKIKQTIFEVCIWFSKGDIYVKKIIVKNYIF